MGLRIKIWTWSLTHDYLFSQHNNHECMHARLLTIWPSCPSYKYSHNNIIIMDAVPKLGGKLSNNSKPLMHPSGTIITHLGYDKEKISILICSSCIGTVMTLITTRDTKL